MVVLTFLLAKATYDYLLDKQRQTAPTHGSGGGVVDRNHYTNNSISNSNVVMTTAASLPASNNTMSTTTTLVPTPRGHYVMDVKGGLLMLPPEPEMHRRSSNATNSDEENGNNAGGIAREENDNSSNANNNTHPDDAFDGDLRKYSIDYANDSNTTPTTFRNDVRNDWVDAIFGKDYFPIIPSSSTSSNTTNNNTTDNGDDTKKSSKGSITSSASSSSIVAMNDIAVRQGVGAAGIPHHVTYGAVLQSKEGRLQQSAGGTTTNDTTTSSSSTLRSTNNISSTAKATSSNSTSAPAKTSATATTSKATSIPSSSSASTTSSQPQQQQQQQHSSSKQKLGITITRIPLGLYVHAISIDSEAYAVGISPGSILIDINGTLGLLGERSDRALERLWRYAGLFSGRSNGSGGGGGGIVGDENYAHNGTGTTTANNNTLSSSSSSGNSLKNRIGSSSKKVDTSNNGGGGCNEHPSTSCKNNLHVKKPIVLRFYQSGRIYQTTLLSGQPFRGIHWAPCGNFALVHKVLPGSIAAEAGVRRGSLVVGVNNKLGLRSLDHGGVARILRDKFMNGESIILSMGYTPAASRSGYHERGGEDSKFQQSSATTDAGALASSKAIKRSGSSGSNGHSRGVEVRSRPVEYSSAMVETLFACTGPGAMDFVDDTSTGVCGNSVGDLQSSDKGKSSTAGLSFASIAEVAAYVAWGGVLPPSVMSSEAASNIIIKQQNSNKGSSSRRTMVDNATKAFSPCPALPPAMLLSEWNALASLARSMAYQAAGSYCETTYTRTGGPFEHITEYGEQVGSRGRAPFSPTECLGMIWEIANNPNRPTIDNDISSTVVAVEKVFDAHLLQLLGVAISPVMGAVEKGQRLSEMLMDIVIDVSLNDISLCQRLFFLLRSFIGELEDQKAPHDSTSEQSTLAIRCCRYAQRRLSGRMFDKSIGLIGENDRPSSIGYPISRESTNSTSSRIQQQQKQLDFMNLLISPTESTLGNSQGGYPFQELNALPVSSLDDYAESGDTGEERHYLSSVVESLSCDVPAIDSGSLRENYDQNPLTSDSSTSIQKKNKSKSILRMLKGSGKNNRSSKKQSGFDHNTVPRAGGSYSPTSNSNSLRTSPKSSMKSSFSFPFVFQKQNVPSALQTIDCNPAPQQVDTPPQCKHVAEAMSLSRKFDNMAWILRQLDNSCLTIERNLMKSFSQKIADWALYSWSASNESALASVTHSFRSELRLINSPTPSSRQNHRDGIVAVTGMLESTLLESMRFPILNPVDPSELLTSIIVDECFILPSAHFPLLLCFDSEYNSAGSPGLAQKQTPHATLSGSSSGETIYRISFEILGINSKLWPAKVKDAFIIQCAVSGVVQASGVSDGKWKSEDSLFSRWKTNNTLVFETSSNWGHPKTLSLKVSTLSKCSNFPDVDAHDQYEVGYGFVDLCPIWKRSDGAAFEARTKVSLFDSVEEFDQHGETIEAASSSEEGLELHFRVKTEVVSHNERPTKRLLLYKHGDDLRQELLAIQFIERCNGILLSSGLDLKLKTFSCQPVGSKTGFIEWVRGTVPLSELCNSTGSSHPGSNAGSRQSSRIKEAPTDEAGALGESFTLDEILGRPGEKVSPQGHRWFKHQSLRGLSQRNNGAVYENPIQDFLRSVAYDASAPYFVRKDVMATYVKSCAGYCVITYLLGVGDRHLDNILLHHNGNLLHCDYSFILGQDPKTYLPMRITEEMMKGFGGHESDNFSKFLSFVGAAFLTLRRHNNLHALLSHIFNMVHANMGDLSINQPPEEAILAMRGRFRLDLNDDDALAYIENVVEKSIMSKMWRAVDVMHSLGKHF